MALTHKFHFLLKHNDLLELTLDHLLELGHRRVLLGVQEHGRLLPADHQEHVHGGGGLFKLRG